MIYNFNLGIGWASSGVEYAQSYRAVMLRNIGADAKFILYGHDRIGEYRAHDKKYRISRFGNHLAVYVFYGSEDGSRYILTVRGTEKNASCRRL